MGAEGNKEATAIHKNPLFKTAQPTQIVTNSSDNTPRARGSKTLRIQTTRNEQRPPRKPLGEGQ